MPKVEIDYSTTIIYKITCNETNVKDVYVGHTTNFVQRKHAHKQSCINEKSPNNKCKLYDVIRNNGGWINWNMEIIHFCNCKNQYEARIKEQEYFVLLNANLNSVEPMRTKLVKLGGDELIHDISINNIKTPSNVNSGIQQLFTTPSTNVYDSLQTKPYICELCDIKTNNKKYYKKHLLTTKHINMVNGLQNDSIIAKIKQPHQVYECLCGKIYQHRQGLHKHKQNCIPTKNNITNSVQTHSSVNSGIQPLFATLTTGTFSSIQSTKPYICELCDIKTNSKKDYKKHLLTTKHINMVNELQNDSMIAKIEKPHQVYECLCGKIYSDRSGLWRHKNICIQNINIDIPFITTEKIENNDSINNNLITEIFKQNQEFKEMILKKTSNENNNSLMIELLKQHQDFKNLMIEQNKYIMDQSNQIVDLAKKHRK